jgi:hypothetical protein
MSMRDRVMYLLEEYQSDSATLEGTNKTERFEDEAINY